MGKVKNKVFEILEKGEQGNVLSRRFDLFIMWLIVINVILVIASTEASFYEPNKKWMDAFEVVSVIIFTIEYVLRIWTCTNHERYRHPITGRLKYMLSFEGIIDLLSILPFYLPLFLTIDGRFIRVLRLFRLFRLLKIGRYSAAFGLIKKVIHDRKEELFVSFFMLVVLLIFASGFMYFIEHEAQPEAFSSIPKTMWWGVATLTTVGYGDVYPITALGRVLGACIAILGIGIFALPAGIIASGFESELSRKRAEKGEE